MRLKKLIPNSIWRKLKGQGVSEDMGKTVMSDLNTNILLKVTNPDHEYSFDQAEEVLSKLSPEVRTEIIKNMDLVAAKMKEFMDLDHSTQKELGEVSESAVMSMVPVKLTSAINSDDLSVNFNDKMSNLIQERLSNEMGGDAVDPISLHAAGLLPDMTSITSMKETLEELKKKYPAWYNELMGYVERYHDNTHELKGRIRGDEDSKTLTLAINRLPGSGYKPSR